MVLQQTTTIPPSLTMCPQLYSINTQAGQRSKAASSPLSNNPSYITDFIILHTRRVLHGTPRHPPRDTVFQVPSSHHQIHVGALYTPANGAWPRDPS